MNNIYLGINIDHIATLRNVREGKDPDPVLASALVNIAGADFITAHLSTDRHHISDRDVRLLRELYYDKLNLEISVNDDTIAVATAIAPKRACIVSTCKSDVLTSGEPEIVSYKAEIAKACKRLKSVGTNIAVYIDPCKEQIDEAKALGVDAVQLNTATYSKALDNNELDKELLLLEEMARYASSLGLRVDVSRGLNYENVESIAKIAEISTIHVGHSVISRALFTGLEQAVAEMKALIKSARTAAYIN